MRSWILAIIGTALIVGVVFMVTSTRDVLPPLPEGTEQLTGRLERIDISRLRRGTHALKVGTGSLIAYIESTTVHLRPLEGSDVTLEGTYERNLDPKDTPVFVTTRLVSGGPTEMHTISIPALRLSIDVPANWRSSKNGSVTTFTSELSSGTLLTVESVVSKNMPFDFKTFSPMSEQRLEIQPTVIINETAAVTWQPSQKVLSAYIRFGSGKIAASPSILRLEFTGQQWGPGVKKGSVPDHILKSLVVNASSSSSRVIPRVGSGSAKFGQPCGGPAGVLCPSGSYCDLSADPKSGIGVCKRY